jgi:2-oxoglutarate dehydrogenase E2 component (dihydrolipoamide succinyltransferase)
MAVQVEVPSLGESVTQAILVTWHKKDGDAVAVDEPIAELETDKANVDIPARAAGILKRLKEEGDTVNVGEAIARIEDGAAASTKSPVAAVITSAPGAADARPAAPTATLEDYSPAVRRLIEEHRVDPGAVPATGPGGRLTKQDVEKFVAERDRNGDRRPAPPAAAAPVSPSTSSGPRPRPMWSDARTRRSMPRHPRRRKAPDRCSSTPPEFTAPR